MRYVPDSLPPPSAAAQRYTGAPSAVVGPSAPIEDCVGCGLAGPFDFKGRTPFGWGLAVGGAVVGLFAGGLLGTKVGIKRQHAQLGGALVGWIVGSSWAEYVAKQEAKSALLALMP